MAVKTLPIDELEYLLSPFQISILLFMHEHRKAMTPDDYVSLYRMRGVDIGSALLALCDLGLTADALEGYFIEKWKLTKKGKKVCVILLAAGWGLTDV